MRALITGIAGFVGSHLAEYLLDNTDWDIDGLIRWQDSLENLGRVVPLAGERVRFFYGDLRDDASVRHAVDESQPRYVFHLAAQSYPLTSFSSPCDTLDTNVQGTVRLLEAVREYRPNAIVHVCSSSEVYGRVGKKHVPIHEGVPFHPASPYAISKAGADLAARFYAEAYGLNIMVTRMFTHTGPRRGDVFAESSFAKQIAMIEAGQIDPVIHVGNLDSMRTIADVRDAVRAYYMLVTVNPVAGEVYNIGGGHSCTVGDILSHLARLSGVSAKIRQEDARMRPLDADLQIPDCRKFIGHTGWKPKIQFEETMADLLDYWRDRVRKVPCLTR